jgi:hypothetical protein
MTIPSNVPARSTQVDERVRNHHTQVWSTGKRGGGKLPADFGWNTNPKQWQEETGSALPETAPDKKTP